MLSRQRGVDRRPPVATLGAEVRVAQRLHQHRPGIRHRLDGDAAGPRSLGKSVAGQRGRHHVECIRGISAMGLGVAERAHDLVHLVEAAGPAVRHHQGQRVGSLARRMHEVHLATRGHQLVLGQRVEGALLGAPVVGVGPVARELAHEGQVGSVVPAGAIHTVRPARGAQAGLQVVELCLGYGDFERARCGHERPQSSGAIPSMTRS